MTALQSSSVTAWLESFVDPGVLDAAPYDATHHDYSWRNRHLGRLMSNECPLPPSDGVLAAATDALRETNLYPHSSADLREALADFAGCRAEQVILGNGSTEILDVAVRTFVRPGDQAVIHVPTYAFFETQVRLNGAEPVPVPLADGHRFDVDALVAAVTPRAKAIFLCSPNNPTGNSWSADELGRVLQVGLPTIVDQAYLECGDSTSFAPMIDDHPNLIVTRTMSKAFGLGGLRVGYGVAHPDVIDVFQRLRIPFSVGLVSASACLAALRDPSYIQQRRNFIMGERGRLTEGLAAIPGVVPFPSDGNFVLMDVSGTAMTSRDIVAALKEDDLLLRAVTAHGMGDHYVRVTVASVEENTRFLRSLEAAVRRD